MRPFRYVGASCIPPPPPETSVLVSSCFLLKTTHLILALAHGTAHISPDLCDHSGRSASIVQP